MTAEPGTIPLEESPLEPASANPAAEEADDDAAQDTTVETLAADRFPTGPIINPWKAPGAPSGSPIAEDLSGLERLLPPLARAVNERRLVIAQGLWQPTELVSLLPFQLHGAWCDALHSLPLSASFSMAPFLPHDWAATEQALFDPAETNQARRQARWQRRAEDRHRRDDFVWPDWEDGYRRNRHRLAGRHLPASAFVGVDVVRSDGRLRRLPRPVLGRYAVRSAPRPWLRVPARNCGATSTAALEQLARADVLIVNLQEMRGERTSSLVRALLRTRGADLPTLVVAASPSDLLFLNDVWLGQNGLVVSIGDGPPEQRVEVVLVGRQRPQVEREFDATLRQLQGSSDELDRLVHLGVAAWWAANQSLQADPKSDHSIRRFLAAVDRFATRSPVEAKDLTGFTQLLLRTLQDVNRIEERLGTVCQVVRDHLNAADSDAVVLVRESSSARVVRLRLAKMMGCQPTELAEAGVIVRAGRALVTSAHPGLAVACGFSGYSTMDAILSSRAPMAALVVDPVEAALATSSVRRATPWLERAGAPVAALQAIAEAAGQVAIRGGDWLPAFTFDVFQTPNLTLPGTGNVVRLDQGESPSLLVRFTDGEELVVDATRRFERLEPPLGRCRVVPASALVPGDEVVLAENTTSFSDRLIQALDADVLADAATKRRTWVMSVSLLVDTQKLRITKIHSALAERGVLVDYQTVRAWTRPTEDDDRVPARWEHFLALAQVVGLPLPESELRELFDAVRVLRIRHRMAGRDVVRMMRAARAGRLDPVSLRRIERDFGIGVRELVQATRVAVVDDVEREE